MKYLHLVLIFSGKNLYFTYIRSPVFDILRVIDKLYVTAVGYNVSSIKLVILVTMLLNLNLQKLSQYRANTIGKAHGNFDQNTKTRKKERQLHLKYL